MKRFAPGMLAAMALAWPGGAAAADASAPPRVALLAAACELPGLSAAELRQAVALDLQTEQIELLPVGERARPTDVEVSLDVDCLRGEALTIRASLAGDVHSRAIGLTEIDTAQRARALSLSLSELVLLFVRPQPPNESERGELTLPEPTEPVPAPPPPVRATRKPTAAVAPVDRSSGATPPEISVGLAPELRVFDGTTLWGARATVQRGAWRLGVDGLSGRADSGIGFVSSFLAHASVSYSVALLRSGSGRSFLEVGARVGLGMAFMNGEAYPSVIAYSARDTYADAAIGARYAFKPGRSLCFGIGAEVGYARGPIGYADGLVAARTAGPFAALLVDGGVRL